MYESLQRYRKILTLLGIAIFIGGQLTAQDLSYASTEEMRMGGPQQDKKVESLKIALEKIKEKYHVTFGYQDRLVNGKTVNTDSLEDLGLDQILQSILTPHGLEYKKLDDLHYVIKAKKGSRRKIRKLAKKSLSINTDNSYQGGTGKIDNPGPANSILSNSLEKIISGKITGEGGEALPGVNVLIKGTTKGTITDVDGNYELNVPDDAEALVFSYVGYLTEEVTIGSQTVINLVLYPDITSLSEVVVIGYGEQKRADLTGAVASVQSEDIANLPTTSLATALQGRVPGAYISQVDGNPNSQASVVIRGPLSINGGQPLYVVDGVPFQGTGFNFNIQDIESIDVLKDASAAAIYGFQAAGGVILITTKKGSDGKLNVGFNANVGVREVINLPETLRRDRYIEAKQAFGFDPVDLYGPESGWSGLPDTDWFDEVYRSAIEQNYTVYMSGGNEKSNFYISANYADIEGTRIGNSINRYTFRVNSEHKVGKRFKFGQTLYGNFREEDPNRSTNQGDLSFRNTPVMLAFDPDNPIGGWGRAPKGFQGGNEVQSALGNFQQNEAYEAVLTLNFDAEITKDLIFKAVFGTSLTGTNNYFYEDRADVGTAITQSRFDKRLSKGQSFIATYTLNYNKSFGEHSINLLAGYEARRANFSDLEGGNINPLVRQPQNFNQVETVTTATVGGRNSDVDNRVLSQFGRIEYAYADKYLLTFNVRRDGLATKFGPNNRYGTFPGVSAGWKISEETFMQGIPYISLLKLRAGYGVLGNSVGDDFAFQAAFATGFSADFGAGRENSVNIENKLPNPDIQWENVTTTNIGIDAGFFEDKLIVNLDYYDRQTKDMIFNLGISPSAGLGSEVQSNVGQMSNKGFEMNIEYRNRLGDFSYSIGVNGATNRNELISLNPDLTGLFLTNGRLTEAHSAAEAVSRSEPGREIANFYGFDVSGIYQTDPGAGETRPTINGGYVPVAGDLIYRDINGDGEINNDDRTYIGSPWPDFTYGINLKLGWKGFDIAAFFNGTLGNDIYNGFGTYEHILFSDYTTTEKIFSTSGFNGNGVTGLPRVGTVDDFDRNLNWSSVNSHHVQSGSYFRLRNIQIGYTFPETFLNRIKLSSVRVFAMADNVFTITSYEGVNPDISTPNLRDSNFLNRGIDNANTRYPVSRLVSFGINASF